MTDNCGVLQTLAEQASDNVVRVPFENTPTIEYYHHTAPRLTSNRDILDEDYYQGMYGFGAAYVGFFLIWLLILGLFKWRGPDNKGGWLSGSRSKTDPQKESSSLSLRIMLYLSILGIITANATLYFTGLADLSVATDAGLETLDQVGAQMKLSVCLFDEVIDRLKLAENNTKELLDRANNVCPNAPFCPNLLDPSSCDDNRRRKLLNPCRWMSGVCDTVSDKVSDIYNEVVGVVKGLIDNVRKGIEFFQEEGALRKQLEDIKDDLNGRIEQKLIQIKEQFEMAEVMVTLSAVLCWLSTIVCLGLLAAHFWKKPRMLQILFGFFLLLTILLLVAAVTSTIAAFAVSDLCIDDPDSRAIELLFLRLDMKSSVLEEMFEGFLKNMAAGNCFQELPTQFLLNGIDFMRNGMDTFSSWSNPLSDRIQEAVCGADATTMGEITELMDSSVNANLDSAAVFLEAGGRLFTCGFWMGLFETGLHQAACYDGMDALATVSLIQFIILCMCMMVVTFRVALWDIIEVEGTTTTKVSGNV